MYSVSALWSNDRKGRGTTFQKLSENPLNSGKRLKRKLWTIIFGRFGLIKVISELLVLKMGTLSNSYSLWIYNAENKLFFVFFWNRGVVDLLNEIISMETTGLMFRAKSGVEESSVLVTIFLSAKVGYDCGMVASRWISISLAFLHDLQVVVDHEPPGGRVPLRGPVMPLPPSVLLVIKHGKHLS